MGVESILRTSLVIPRAPSWIYTSGFHVVLGSDPSLSSLLTTVYSSPYLFSLVYTAEKDNNITDSPVSVESACVLCRPI